MEQSLLLTVCWLLTVVAGISNDVFIDCKEDSCRLLGENMLTIKNLLNNHGSVRNVDLHGNLLENFDANVLRNLNNLQSLNLSYNLLEDDVLRNIQNRQLRTIDITYNNLSFVNVPVSVNEFYAVRNQLYHISVPYGHRLSKLVLSKNKFESLENFGAIQSLTFLDLSCNRITIVKTQNLAQSLEYLNLANNFINIISEPLNLPNLKHLDLSNNWLLSLSVGSNINKLETLSLQNNKIIMLFGQVGPAIKSLNLVENDWECNNLRKLLGNQRSAIEKDQNVCQSDNVSGLCCSTQIPLMAARLNKYRRDEFNALKDSTILRKSNWDCKNHGSGPCEGDDRLVYKVASSAHTESQSLVKSESEAIEHQLRLLKNAVTRNEQNLYVSRQENDKVTSRLNKLQAYIDEEYNANQLSGAQDTVEKIKEIFDVYETNSKNNRERIKNEENNNQKKQREVTEIEDRIEELNNKKNRLEAAIISRNKTVTDYNAIIAQLNKKLGSIQ